jgi:hypothetical protein
LSIWGDVDNERQPTSSGNRNFFSNVIALLKDNGITNKDAIVIQGEGYSYLTWYLGYPLTRRYETNSGDEFEIGDKVFLVDTALGVSELNKALDSYPTGYLLWHSSLHGESNFSESNFIFTYLGTSEGYKLFRWNVATSALSAL